MISGLFVWPSDQDPGKHVFFKNKLLKKKLGLKISILESIIAEVSFLHSF